MKYRLVVVNVYQLRSHANKLNGPFIFEVTMPFSIFEIFFFYSKKSASTKITMIQRADCLECTISQTPGALGKICVASQLEISFDVEMNLYTACRSLLLCLRRKCILPPRNLLAWCVVCRSLNLGIFHWERGFESNWTGIG